MFFFHIDSRRQPFLFQVLAKYDRGESCTEQLSEIVFICRGHLDVFVLYFLKFNVFFKSL